MTEINTAHFIGLNIVKFSSIMLTYNTNIFNTLRVVEIMMTPSAYADAFEHKLPI